MKWCRNPAVAATPLRIGRIVSASSAGLTSERLQSHGRVLLRCVEDVFEKHLDECEPVANVGFHFGFITLRGFPFGFHGAVAKVGLTCSLSAGGSRFRAVS